LTTKNSVVAVFLLLLATVVPSVAESRGNEVLDKCQTSLRFYENNGAPPGEHFDAGWCIGWINSALELNHLNAEWLDMTKVKSGLIQFCTPVDGIPVIQAVRIVVKYLKNHPEQLHENGMGLTVAALKDSFPCKASN